GFPAGATAIHGRAAVPAGTATPAGHGLVAGRAGHAPGVATAARVRAAGRTAAEPKEEARPLRAEGAHGPTAGKRSISRAPAEVLATVPGMTHDALNAIISHRQGGGAFQSLGDLFTLDGITQQTMQNILSHLCTKSSAYRVRIKVRTQGQQSLYAVTALVE